MSRLGKTPISIPKGVTVNVANGVLKVEGKKGALAREVPPELMIATGDGEVKVTMARKTDLARKLWGTYAAHLKNMMIGVSDGFTKVLDLEGVGYRAELKGRHLALSVGFSHPVTLEVPTSVAVAVEKGVVTLASCDKEALGQFAANVRAVKPPEPYKGKGIRYRGEHIIRKQGKKSA
jgi:large subunit ribosomal protein L6